MLAEFELIMKENQNSMLISQKAEWWKLRQKLDEKLQVMMVTEIKIIAQTNRKLFSDL